MMTDTNGCICNAGTHVLVGRILLLQALFWEYSKTSYAQFLERNSLSHAYESTYHSHYFHDVPFPPPLVYCWCYHRCGTFAAFLGGAITAPLPRSALFRSTHAGGGDDVAFRRRAQCACPGGDGSCRPDGEDGGTPWDVDGRASAGARYGENIQ